MIEAGLSEQQVRGVLTLHQQWAREEFGHELDTEKWLVAQWGLVRSGRYNVVVAWDGEEPVGCVDMILVYDPMSHQLVGHGDRAFVAADYRASGVFRLLHEAVYNLGVAMGCTKILCPVGVDETGQFMRRHYERSGFEVSGMTMRKIPSGGA